ncbi:MAG: SOS response-associated peptidase [Vulcanimicrobiaceae bacterium]
MCGRYSLLARRADLVRAFPRLLLPDDYDAANPPRYNVAPSQPVATITNLEPRTLTMLPWGLSTGRRGSISINARGESVADKPAFRHAFRSQRCLIPADGYYEWRSEGGSRQPLRIVRRSRRPFAFAGVWESGCAIVTCAARGALAEVHDREPAILAPETYEEWLSDETPVERLRALTVRALPDDDLEFYEVSKLVNSPQNETPEVIERVESPPALRLF